MSVTVIVVIIEINPTAVSVVYLYLYSLFSLCIVCNYGDLQLVGGNEIEGLVEVCHNNTYVSICHSKWDVLDGRVACQQLGYARTSNNYSYPACRIMTAYCCYTLQI